MDHIIELSANEAHQLLAELAAANSKSLHTLRVCVEGDSAKFKVNQWTWSPPMGHLDPECHEAEKRRSRASFSAMTTEEFDAERDRNSF